MDSLSNAELVELAYAISNDEESEAARLLEKWGRQCDDVDAYRRVIELVRVALASSPPSAGERVGGCLDDETVAGYLDHSLPPREKAAAEAHFSRCQACLGQLSELAQLVSEAPARYECTSPLTYVVEVARRGIRLLAHPEAGFSPLEAAPAAVLGVGAQRSSEAQKCCSWRQYFGVYSVLISVIQASDEWVDVSLAVSKDSAPVPKTRITLRRDDHIVQSESTAESGRVCLPSLEMGVYECEIRLPEGDLRRHFRLDLREADM